MKKMIILVGLSLSFTLKAETYLRTPVQEIAPVENMYAAFEIKTPKFDQVVLDCQSFIHGMTFYMNKQKVHTIRMTDYGDCEGVYQFINQSLEDKKSVCMELAEKSNGLTLSNDGEDDCQ